MDRLICPACGDSNWETDPTCLSCGESLACQQRKPPPNGPESADDCAGMAPAAQSDSAGNVRGIRAWFDLATELGQKRVAILSGIVMLLCVGFLLQGLMPFVIGIACALGAVEFFWEMRERRFQQRFVAGVEAGGGDKAALQAELSRLHRPDSFRVGPKGASVPVKGFDSRLDETQD